jgi:hypothetical protein
MSLRESREDFNTVSIGTTFHHIQMPPSGIGGRQTARKFAYTLAFRPLRETLIDMGEKLLKRNCIQD